MLLKCFVYHEDKRSISRLYVMYNGRKYLDFVDKYMDRKDHKTTEGYINRIILFT